MNQPLFPELSVFYPCYNEEKNITATVTKAIPVVKKVASKWEIILVNDGSKDNTLKKLQKLQKKYGSPIKIVNHSTNRGYGAAFKSGIYNSRYQWITFTDADGQFDFNDIYLLAKKQKATVADAVIGFYLDRKVPFYRKLGSMLWQLAVLVLFSLKVRDIDCGFKLFSKKIVDSLPHLEAERGPFISSEFLIGAKRAGYKIVEEGVHHYPRQAGQATGTNLNVIFAGLKDLLHLWVKNNLTNS